jgi:hypothetical protein
VGELWRIFTAGELPYKSRFLQGEKHFWIGQKLSLLRSFWGGVVYQRISIFQVSATLALNGASREPNWYFSLKACSITFKMSILLPELDKGLAHGTQFSNERILETEPSLQGAE